MRRGGPGELPFAALSGPGMRSAHPCAREAPEQRRPVRGGPIEVAQRPGDQPRAGAIGGREARGGGRGARRYRPRGCQTPSAQPSPSCPNRASAWRRRSRPRRSSAARAGRQRARRDMKRARLPQGQGAAAGRHPALGREVVLDEAIRASLGRWYVGALDAAGSIPSAIPTSRLAG